jgi:hypothetical protein
MSSFLEQPSTPQTYVDDDNSNIFNEADTESQLSVLFSCLNIDQTHELHGLAKIWKSFLNSEIKKTVKYAITFLLLLDFLFNFFVRFITITSGENAGERRQIYEDDRGNPFFWQGKKFPKKQYLTEYIDGEGVKRSPNASNRALKQYAELQADIVPTQLFIVNDAVHKVDTALTEDDIVQSVVDATTEKHTLTDEEITSQHSLAEELELKDGPA